MFSLSLEQTAKCNAQGAGKNSTSMHYICQKVQDSVQDSFRKLLSNEAWKKDLSFLVLGSDILTP